MAVSFYIPTAISLAAFGIVTIFYLCYVFAHWYFFMVLVFVSQRWALFKRWWTPQCDYVPSATGIMSLAHFLTESLFLLFSCWVLRFLNIVEILTSVRYMVCIYFLPVHGLPFFSLYRVFCTTNTFNFGKSIYLFSSMDCAFGITSKNALPSPRSWRFFSCIIFKKIYIFTFNI